MKLASKGNWFKLYRQIIKSDVAQSDELLGLFIRILANVNFEKRWFKQVEIQPGQLAFAWRTLRKRLYRTAGPSHNTLRSRVLFLHSIGVIVVETHSSKRFSILTVPNWQKYQSRSVPKIGTVSGTATGTVGGTEIRKPKKDENLGASLFESESSKGKQPKQQWPMPDGVNPDHWRDWLAHRKTKRASNTPSAWSRILREAEKAGWPIAKIVQHCAERSWAGFDSSWIANTHQAPIEIKPFVPSTGDEPIKPRQRAVS